MSPIFMFLMYLAFIFFLLRDGFGNDNEFLEINDEGPAHDSMTGDYEIDKNLPPYTPPEPPLSGCLNSLEDKYVHPDLYLKCDEIIEKYDYDLETHTVTTEDGYILTLFRIKGSPKSPRKPGKVPVLLVHGLTGNCMSWLFLWKDKSLAFKLADGGYDVWLANIRGTSYSQNHTKFDTDSEDYWDFSYDDTGYYDIPAMIDHILNVTCQKDLYFVGHSLGTTHYLLAMSDRPEYGQKIRVGFLLGPAGLYWDMSNPLVTAVLDIGTPYHSVWKTEFGNYVDDAKLNGDFKGLKLLCPSLLVKCGACRNLMFTSNGFNPSQHNGSIVFFFSSRFTDATSTKIFCQIAQARFRREEVMRKFDYMNEAKNKLKYGTSEPPNYHLHRITSPTIFFWGLADNLTPPLGVKKTALLFSKGVIKENNRVPDPEFNHLDFIVANDINRLVYDRIQYVMDKKLYLENK